MSKPIVRMALALLACVLINGAAQAQSWPTKPVRVVVPFTAGSATDTMARTVGDAMSKAMGQPFVVDNKPGAGGTIGSDIVAKAPADGYTLLLATSSTHSIGPSFGARLRSLRISATPSSSGRPITVPPCCSPPT